MDFGNFENQLFTCLISFNTLWDEESEIFLQIMFSISISIFNPIEYKIIMYP